MSSSRLIELDCPECGNSQEVLVWGSINVTLDPSLKRKLLNGQINVFECSSCGTKAWLGAQSLLYHDMRARLMVHYFPPESLDNPEFLSSFTPEGRIQLNIPEVLLGMYDVHIVFDMAELVRYVVFRDRLCRRSTAH